MFATYPSTLVRDGYFPQVTQASSNLESVLTVHSSIVDGTVGAAKDATYTCTVQYKTYGSAEKTVDLLAYSKSSYNIFVE